MNNKLEFIVLTLCSIIDLVISVIFIYMAWILYGLDTILIIAFSFLGFYSLDYLISLISKEKHDTNN